MRPRRPGARLTPARLLPPPRPGKGEVSLPPVAGVHAPPALGGCGHQCRASGDSETADGSRSRDLSTPAGNKSRVRTSRRDQPRLREGERGGEGSGSRCRPAPRLPEGATAPSPGVAWRKGPRSGAGGLRRAGFKASRAPLAQTSRSRAREPREGAGRWNGSGRSAKEGIRLPGHRSCPPHPCGHGADTCRSSCSSVPSLSLPHRTTACPSARPAGRPRTGRRSPRLAAPASRPNPRGSARHRPAPACRRTRLPLGPGAVNPPPKGARAVALLVRIGGRAPSMQIRPRPRPFAPPP